MEYESSNVTYGHAMSGCDNVKPIQYQPQNEALLYQRRTGSNALHSLDVGFSSMTLDKSGQEPYLAQQQYPSFGTASNSPYSTPTAVLDYTEDMLPYGLTEKMLEGVNNLGLSMISAAQKSIGVIRRQLIMEAMNTFQEILAVSPDNETAVSALALCLTELRSCEQ